ncbi:MAG: peptidoglycan-binding domain-containing protein [Bacteroidota bacterium]
MKSLLVFVFALTLLNTAVMAQDSPPNAMPGKCYAKCLMPDQFENVTEQVLVRAGYKRLTAVPAELEARVDQLEIKPAGRRLISEPAKYEVVEDRVMVKSPGNNNSVYETVTENILVKPEEIRFVVMPATYKDTVISYVVEAAHTRLEVLQPAYESVTERVEVKPAGVKWVKKLADATCLGANPDDCYVWCMVETPAEYATITKRVNKGCDGSGIADAGCIKTVEVPAKMGTRTVKKLVKDTYIKEEKIPAEYRPMTIRRAKTEVPIGEATVTPEYVTVKKNVMVSPPAIREETVPAETAPFNVKSVKKEASLKSEDVPAEYITVTRRKLVRPGGFTAWREVLCPDRMPAYTIKQVQAALLKAGYFQGTPDNVMGERTKSALAKFQKDKGLPVGNLDLETLKALGITAH